MINYTINVPCRKVIYKYFTALYGSVLIPTPASDFGDSVLTKLSSKSLNRLSQAESNRLLLAMDHKLPIKLPADYFYRIQRELTDLQIYNLNRYLKNKFENDLYYYVNVVRCFGVERKKAIEAFCHRYNIILGEDIDFEALQKREIRIRNQKAQEKDFLADFGTRFTSHILSEIKSS